MLVRRGTMDHVSSSDEPLRSDEPSPPLISFILPTYNARSHLTRCLDAVTGQEFKNIEIIAVDGASQDGSADILDERKLAESRLHVIRDQNKIAPSVARNIGADRAQGRYLGCVDTDDV